MISLIIPAHNEEAWIERSVSAICTAMNGMGEPYEVLVVDDASTDSTAAVARQHGAHEIVRVEHRQISATRNAGARHARGDIFFFVDADTLVNAEVVRSALRSLRAGAVGGGCVPRFEGRTPLWWKLSSPFITRAIRWLRLPGGACQFCTRDAFIATGGFSEELFAAEDALFVKDLKRYGPFVVVPEPVVTSGRNLRAHSFWSIARLLTRLALRGPQGFRDRAGLDLWYQPRREKPE